MIYLIIVLAIFILTTRATKNKICRNYVESYRKSTYLDEVEVDGSKTRISKPKCPRCGSKEITYQIIPTTARGGKYISGTHIYNEERAICAKCGYNFMPMLSQKPGFGVWIISAAVGLFVVSISCFVFAFVNLIFM